MLMTGTTAEVAVFLLVPKKRVPDQMFSNYGILYVRFRPPLGNARGDLLGGCKFIFFWHD